MKTWRTKQGREIPIRDIESGHLISILRILKKQASALWRKDCNRLLGEGATEEALELTWQDYVHEQFGDLVQEAECRGLSWDLWEGGPARDAEDMDVVDLSRRGQLERKVVGALRNSIDSHGPITKETAPSAAKRVIGAIKDHNQQAREVPR